MTSPWEILGLPPGSSVDEVRRAYARLLRQNRPDVDPVGFRRLRDAYEFALRAARWRAAGIEIEQPDEEVAQRDDGEAPPATVRWFGALEEPAAEPARARPRQLATPLRTALVRARACGRKRAEVRLYEILGRSLRERPGEPDLVEVVREELASPQGEMRMHLHPRDVQGVTSRGDANLTRALLLAHLVAADWQRFWAAVRAIEEAPATNDDLAGVVASLEAAQVVALLEPTRAEQLADLAFRRAPSHARHMVGEVDNWIQAGKQLRGNAFLEDKRRLALALCDVRLGADDPVAQRALAIALDAPKVPLLAALLAERFPTAAAKLEPLIERAKKRALRTSRRRRRPQGESRTFSWFWVIWLVIIASVNVRHCDSPAQPVPASREQRVLDALERTRKQQPRRDTDPPQPDSRGRR